MNMEKMKEVFSDKAFVESLFELETVAEVQAALKEKDVELSEEEILSIRDLLGKVENGELSEELLEQVSGGSILAAIGGIAAAALGIADIIIMRW